MHRDALRRIEPFFSVAGSFFGPQMMVLSILMRQKMIQIPVNYRRWVGTSSVTGNKWVALRLGIRMILLILDYRLRSWLSSSRFERPPVVVSPEVLGDEFPRRRPTADLVAERDDEDEEKSQER